MNLIKELIKEMKKMNEKYKDQAELIEYHIKKDGFDLISKFIEGLELNYGCNLNQRIHRNNTLIDEWEKELEKYKSE